MYNFKAMNPAQMKEQIVRIGTSVKRYEAMVSHVAKSAIIHCQHHNDTRYIKDLVDIMPKSTKTQGLINFIKEFAPVSYKKETGFKYNKRAKNRKDKEFKAGNSLFEAMVSADWVEFKKETTKKEKSEEEKNKIKVENFKKWLATLSDEDKASYVAMLTA